MVAAAKETTTPTTNQKPIEFERVSLPEIDGWYDPTKQGDVTGRLLGWKKLAGKGGMQDRYFVLLALIEPCKGVLKEGKEVALKPGQTIGLTLRAQLMLLLEYVDSKPAVQIKSLGKKKLDAKRSLWNFDVQVQKGYRKNASPIAAEVAASVDDSDDDVHF